MNKAKHVHVFSIQSYFTQNDFHNIDINIVKSCRKVHYRRQLRSMMEGGIVIRVPNKLSRAIDHVERSRTSQRASYTTRQHANCHREVLQEWL